MQIANTAKVCETLLIVCETLLMVAMHGTSLLENGEQTYGKLSEAGYCGVLRLTKEVGGVLRGTVGYCGVLHERPNAAPFHPPAGAKRPRRRKQTVAQPLRTAAQRPSTPRRSEATPPSQTAFRPAFDHYIPIQYTSLSLYSFYPLGMFFFL